ncbi:MAG: hypothetical protein AVDCRST_MAG55-3308, partial [uncultured Rubrobacteraceae bacterium]
ALREVRRPLLGAGEEHGRAGGRPALRAGRRRPEPALRGRGGGEGESLREAARAADIPAHPRLREDRRAGAAPRRPDPWRVPDLLRAPAPRRRRAPVPPDAQGLLRQAGPPRPPRLPSLRADRRGRGWRARLYYERHRRRYGGRATEDGGM